MTRLQAIPVGSPYREYRDIAGLQALVQINTPPPAPPGMPQPPEEPGIGLPEEAPPLIDEPAIDPAMPIREPVVIRPPQAAFWWH